MHPGTCPEKMGELNWEAGVSQGLVLVRPWPRLSAEEHLQRAFRVTGTGRRVQLRLLSSVPGESG